MSATYSGLAPLARRDATGGATMSGQTNFCIEQHGATLVIAPQCDLGSLAEMDLESELSSLLQQFANSDLKNVLVDFQRVPYFGSTMISILIRLNKMTRSRGGRMALCSLSATETEVLRVMKLQSIWPQYPSRQDSLDALSSPLSGKIA